MEKIDVIAIWFKENWSKLSPEVQDKLRAAATAKQKELGQKHIDDIMEYLSTSK